MKTSDHSIDSHELAAAVQAARKRFGKAETTMEGATQRASIAKRKRKQAKEAARSAKKDLKCAKKELLAAKRELADAEKTLTRAASKVVTNVKPASPAKAVKPPSVKASKPKATHPRIRRKPTRTAVIPPSAPEATAGPESTELPVSAPFESDAMPGGEHGENGAADQTHG